jgi:hypothetical protein
MEDPRQSDVWRVPRVRDSPEERQASSSAGNMSASTGCEVAVSVASTGMPMG